MVWLSKQFVRWLNWIAPFVRRSRVEDISTEELRGLLERDDESFVLVDVRSQSERDVSQIPGAISMDEFWSRRDELKNRTVIASCTVGGRSLLFAQRCLHNGIPARNYRPGILGWCEAGGELVDPQGQTTRRVHTHNKLLRAPDGYESVP
ncbi:MULTISPECIES: rhodanese-like domain-containing protein [Rhodopirellula]|uniref:rhodanese-like domain-containing protein n=1 Tax=Rhodopirellula TaxID=265488 RepID=UPI00257954D5|nr:rhodanese-like domain-containing protein [Rhodopirellula sp. UBA1907]|tara:strand:+ start:1602 stop:2051 length:450 start_codon:yes stop_codon:yes gene_type:complete